MKTSWLESSFFRFVKLSFFGFLLMQICLCAQINAQTSIHLTLGNPSNAQTNVANSAGNYLLIKPEFVLSYNRTLGGPNWVSWHLDASDLGGEDRGNFAPDLSLPRPWQILPNDYARSGYDRGHVCPSGDRTANRASNDATFVMSNMLPQEGDINRFAWAKLEMYTREVVSRGGAEAYIIAGGYGSKEKIARGKINVPTNFWKIIVFLPKGENDLKRINRNTRVIAIDMPNDKGLSGEPWNKFITTADAIEQATGYDFLSNVPLSIQAVIEARKDSGRDLPKGKDFSALITLDDDTSITAKTIDNNARNEMSAFDFPAPKNLTGKKTLWATNYYVYGDLRSETAGIPLLTMTGKKLGATLAPRDWCLGGVEGTFRIVDEAGNAKTFNYAGTAGKSLQADCSPYIRSRSINLTALGKSRYMQAKGEFGDGVKGMILVPYRTIAVDPKFISYGTVVYIPAARGVEITLPDGTKVKHDGYFFAADTGGAIKQNHIDVFTGISRNKTFEFVKIKETGTFEAYIIDNAQIAEKLRQSHTP